MRFTLCSLYLALHYGRKLPRIQIGVLGHSLVRLLVPSHRSLVCSLAHFAHSLARGTVNYYMAILSVFFLIFDRSADAIFILAPFSFRLVPLSLFLSLKCLWPSNFPACTRVFRVWEPRCKFLLARSLLLENYEAV